MKDPGGEAWTGGQNRSSKAVHLASTPQSNSGAVRWRVGAVGFTNSALGVWPQFGVTRELLTPNFSAQVVPPTGRHKALAIHIDHSQTAAAF